MLFVNDLPSATESDVMLFADDTKLWRLIRDDTDILALQNDINRIIQWCDKWSLKLNVKKCKHMSIAVKNEHQSSYHMSINGNEMKLDAVNMEKDLGITFDKRLEFDYHIQEKTKKANSMYGMLRRTFKHLDEKTFVPLYKTMARSQLDYGCVIWNPYKEKYNEQIEKVQRRATKTLPKLNKLEYIDRLKKLKLPCLKYRRLRGDLIEAYKILRGSYDNNVLKNILITKDTSSVRHSQRGHQFMLQTQSYKTRFRKNYFSLRITNIWNNLPKHVVEAVSVNSFKNLVDGHFRNTGYYYDYKYKPEVEL